MLFLVALSIVAPRSRTDEPNVLHTPQEISQALASLGYDFRPSAPQAVNGTLTHNGVTVTCGLALGARPQDQGKTPHVAGIMPSIEVAVAIDVPLHEANRGYGSFIPSPTIFAVPHLGRTVTLSQDIDLREGLNLLRLRKALDRFWLDADAYARRHGGVFAPAPERDWTKAHFPNALVVERVDDITIGRLAASWGLSPAPATAGLRLFGPCYGVDGTVVVVDTSGFGFPQPGRTCKLEAEIDLPRTVDFPRWKDAQVRLHPTLEFWPFGREEIKVSEVVDLGSGLSVGDLHRRITSFAAIVADLPRFDGAKP